MYHYFRIWVLGILLTLLVSCIPVTPVPPAVFTQAVSIRPPSSDSIKPPAATLEINGKTQTAGIGSYCWSEDVVNICADMAGLPTAPEPLIAVSTPYTARFHLPLDVPPSSLYISVMPALYEKQGDFGNVRMWDTFAGWSGALPLKMEVEYTFQEGPGLYLLELSVSWEGRGDVVYGFLVHVGEESSPAITIPGTPAPSPAITTFKVISPEVRIGRGIPRVLALSQDGQWLALGTSLGVYLLDTFTQKELWFRAFDSIPQTLAFKPDGAQLAVGLAGNLMPVVDVQTGETMFTLQGEESLHGVWSPDGKAILTSGGCEQVLVWDVASRRITHTLQPARCDNVTPGYVNAAWSGNGKRIYVNTNYGNVLAWDAATYEPLKGYTTHPPQFAFGFDLFPAPLGNLFALPNGLEIAIMSGDTGEIVKTLTSDSKDVPLMGLTWSPNGKLLAAGNYYSLYVWEIETGRLLAYLNDYQVLASAAWMPDNQTMVGLFGKDGSLNALNIITGDKLFSMPSWGLINSNLSPHWDGQTLLTYTGTFEFRWNPHDGQLISQRETSEPAWVSTSYAARSPGGQFIASPNAIRDSKTGNEITQLHDARQYELVEWSPDGTQLISAIMLDADAYQTVVWDASNGEVVRKLKIDSSNLQPYIGALAWSPNSSWIAAAGSLLNSDNGFGDGFITIWDAQTGQPVITLTSGMHADRIYAMAWSPDNRWLAAGGESGKIYVWDMQTRTPVALLGGHTAQVDGLSWSPTTNLLASAAADGTVLIWQVP